MLKAYFIAQQFLTRLPCPHSAQLNDKDMGLSVLFYPLIGFLIGLILVTASDLLSFLTPNITAIIILILSIIINGALHIDGLADSADAWLAGGDKEKSLGIMQDPHLGTAGVVATTLLLLSKYVILVEILKQDYWLLMLIASIFARSVPIAFMLWLPYVRTNGIATILIKNLPRRKAKLLLLCIIGFLAWFQLATLILTLFILYLLVRLMNNRLGGFTGDTLGASIEITELSFMFIFVVLMQI